MGLMGPELGQSLEGWVTEKGNPSTVGGGAAVDEGMLALISANYAFNMIRNGSFESWLSGTTSAPTGWTLSGAGATISRDVTNFQRDRAGASFVAAANTATELSQSLLISSTVNTQLRGKTVTFSCYVKASAANRVFMRVNDGVKTVDGVPHPGDGTFRKIYVSLQIDTGAGQLACSINISSGTSITVVVDAAMLCQGKGDVEFSPHPSDVFQTPAPVSATGATTTTSASYVDLNTMSIANIILDGSQSVLIFFSGNCHNNDVGGDVRVQLVRGSTQLLEGIVDVHSAASFRNMSLSWIDSKPAAGTYTYKAQWLTNLGTATFEGRYMSLLVVPAL